MVIHLHLQVISNLILDKGIIYGFGDNKTGQLGNGNNYNILEPIEIKNLENHKIICGYDHTISKFGKIIFYLRREIL